MDEDLDPYDLVTAGLIDSIVERTPLGALWDISVLAQDASQFFAATQAQIKLQDIVYEHYTEKNATFTEEASDLIPSERAYFGGPDGPQNIVDSGEM